MDTNYDEEEIMEELPEENELLTPEQEAIEFEKLIDKLNVVPSTDVKLQLEKCPICSRTFVPESLAKHIGICEKMNTKKRKKFDSSRQRIEGTELASYKPILPMTSTLKAVMHTAEQPQPIKISPPKTSPLPRKFEQKTPTAERKENIMTTSAGSVKLSSTKRITAQPQNEQCPYCERCFGIKAYDRHVEWCKEKALLKQINNKEIVSAAKERLQARIKYKAPNLKTKRQVTREKYSGSLSCSGSTTSLNDIGTPLFKQGGDKKNLTISNSMTSSMTSESGLSDRNYDPFLSAKRQLEELFSPTSTNTSTPKPTTNAASAPKPAITPAGDKPDGKLMTSSLKVTPIAMKKLTPTTTIPTNRSNFRRTSSLRISKNATKPLFGTAQRSTIQRGISPDDGPISPNFVRANEYDEIPVKSAFNAITQKQEQQLLAKSKPSTPSYDERPIISRLNSALSDSRSRASSVTRSSRSGSVISDRKSTEKEDTREEMRLNISEDTEVVRRESSANCRKNLRLDILSPIQPATPDYSVSKTDSLAIFLKYEQDMKDNSSCLTEKDLKDKSNSLSKRSSTVESTKENVFENERLPDIKQNLPCNGVTITTTTTTASQPQKNLRLEAIEKKVHYEPFTDSKLINVCDNLPLSITKLPKSSDRSSSSSSDAGQSKRDGTPEKFIPSNRSSGEKRSILRRQVKLNKNSILYDTSPTETDDQKKLEKTDKRSFKRGVSTDAELESIFDDFDFEEFISSFEDDENYPIFKDYKNILLSRTISDSNKNLGRSDSETDHGEFNGNKPSRNSSSNTVTGESNITNEGKVMKSDHFNINIEDLSPTERELLKSVNELNDMCSQGTYPVDSDDLSSIEGYPLRNNAGSKMSADSAYGSSLSRQSPPDRNLNRRLPKTRGDLRMPEIQPSKIRVPARPRDNLSMSSSGSESSLPPINANLKTQKMELHPHKEKTATLTADCKMSKFCHECGSRFKVATAKFCMECGSAALPASFEQFTNNRMLAHY